MTESFGPHPHVLLRLPDGSSAALEPGDLIGRVWSAALPIDDPRISEAHALISLRDGALWLLSLRRLVAVDKKPVGEVRLVPGLAIELADGLTVQVREVVLPDRLLTIEGDGLPAAILPSVCSIVTSPRPALSARHDPLAPCTIWSTGTGFRIRIGATTSDLETDRSYEIPGLRFRIASRAVSGAERTRDPGGVHAPLRIVAAWDTVQIHREGEPIAVLGGLAARIVSELVALGGPAHWATVAAEIWPHERDEGSLRKRWDVAMVRTRARLREERIRTDLIHADGSGRLELLLREGDRVEDRT